MNPTACDCGNPECELSRGRCLFCGNPCDANNSGNEVCGRRTCRPLLLRAYKTSHAVEGVWPAWAPFNEAGDGSWEIQRIDDGGVYADDDEAAAHVLALLQIERAT